MYILLVIFAFALMLIGLHILFLTSMSHLAEDLVALARALVELGQGGWTHGRPGGRVQVL